MSFKETEVGMIPEDWKVQQIGKLGKVVGGGTPKTKIEEYWNGDISWITPRDLSGYSERFIYKGERSITQAGLENSSAKLLPKGTLLFSSRAPIGYVAIAGKEMATNQGFKSIVCNEKLAYNLFLYYLMKQKKRDIEMIAGGSTFKEVSGKVIKEFKIQTPPLDEQKAIAKILSSLDEKIEINNQINKNLEKMAQAIFKHWFVDFEFPCLPDGAGKPYDEKDLVKICTYKRVGGLPGPAEDRYFVYVILCEDGSFYKGMTEDLYRRFYEHYIGIGADWTKIHKPVKVIHYEVFETKEDARKREEELKTGFGRKWLKREYEKLLNLEAGLPAQGEDMQAGLPAQKEEDMQAGLPAQKEEDMQAGLPAQKEKDMQAGLPAQKEKDMQAGLPAQGDMQAGLPAQKEEDMQAGLPAQGDMQAGLPAPKTKLRQAGEMVNSELGLIPKGWEVKNLAEVAEFQNGHAFYKVGYSEKGYKVVDLANVNIFANFVEVESDKYVSEDVYNNTKYQKYHLMKDDLVMIMTDRTQAMNILGKTAKIPYSNQFILNQRVGRIRANDGLNVNYLKCTLNSERVLNILKSKALGSVQKYINTNHIKEIKVLIPNTDKMEHFSNLINPYFDKMQFCNGEKRILEHLRDTLLPKLMSGEIRVCLPDGVDKYHEADLSAHEMKADLSAHEMKADLSAHEMKAE